MISALYAQKKPVISFEIFPPKKDVDISTIYDTLNALSGLGPDFISVTYGAGGAGAHNRTGEIAAKIQAQHHIEALAHLTCVATGRRRVHALLDEMQNAGVHNVLAMRGDLPRDPDVVPSKDYRYAADLIADIRERGGFCIGAACYPEGHIECDSFEESVLHMKQKQDAGADFFVTQLFFENRLFWQFLEAARKAGVTRPISAGVMPILSKSQVERMIFMCGASLPSAIVRLLHKYEGRPEDLTKAGIEHAAEQMRRLAEGGADGVHVYTMNRPEIATAAMARLRP